jgi:hypothetical protein
MGQTQLAVGIDESHEPEIAASHDGFDEMRREIMYLQATIEALVPLLGADRLDDALSSQNPGLDGHINLQSQPRQGSGANRLQLVVGIGESSDSGPRAVQGGYDTIRRQIKHSQATVKAMLELLP